jgi:glutamate 5-kinase
VKGTFVRGEVVPIEGPEGERVAVGIVNYSDADVESIKGQRSDRIPDFLSGYHYGAEVVHRNNMVVL